MKGRRVRAELLNFSPWVENNAAICVETSSAAAAATLLVCAEAAVVALFIVDPMSATFEATVASASGAATTKDMSAPLSPRQFLGRDLIVIGGYPEELSARRPARSHRAVLMPARSSACRSQRGATVARMALLPGVSLLDARMKFDRWEVTPKCL